MAFKYAPRVKETSTTTGTGTLNLAGAATGYQTFVAGVGDTNTCPYFIEDANGTAWEEGIGTVTDAATDTLARTTLIASSTGSAISLSAGTHNVWCGWPARDAQSAWDAYQTHISGLIVTKYASGNTIDVSAGTCFDPSSGKVIRYAGATNISVGTLNTANPQWNQVYIYDNAGTATIEVVVNAAPPSTTYAGTARQGGTTITNKRWIGSFLSNNNASGNIVAQDVREIGSGGFELCYLIATNAIPFRIISAGAQLSYTASTAVGCVPRYVANELFCNVFAKYSTTAAANIIITFSVDGTNQTLNNYFYVDVINLFPGFQLWCPLEVATPQIHYKVAVVAPGAGPNVYVDVNGYRASR